MKKILLAFSALFPVVAYPNPEPLVKPSEAYVYTLPVEGIVNLTKDWRFIAVSDGTSCKVMTIKNLGLNPAEIQVKWTNNQVENFTVAPGDQVPIICLFGVVKGKCKQDPDKPGEETTTIKWTLQ